MLSVIRAEALSEGPAPLLRRARLDGEVRLARKAPIAPIIRVETRRPFLRNQAETAAAFLAADATAVARATPSDITRSLASRTPSTGVHKSAPPKDSMLAGQLRLTPSKVVPAGRYGPPAPSREDACFSPSAAVAYRRLLELGAPAAERRSPVVVRLRSVAAGACRPRRSDAANVG